VNKFQGVSAPFCLLEPKVIIL